MNSVAIPGKTDMTEVDLIIHILSNLPEEYEVVVSKIEEKLKTSPFALQLEDVRTDLNSRFKCIQKNEEETSTEEGLSSAIMEALSELDETALAAFIKKLKGLRNNVGNIDIKGLMQKQQ
jgi:stage III sporulation protein SpoIIIAA